MIRTGLLYIVLAGTLLSFTACDRLIYDFYDADVEETSDEPVVYLNIQRVQAAGVESFNADADDYEDRVHDLAMLVFDASTGAKVCSHFDSNIPFSDKKAMFTVELTTGAHDFYFVANMPMGDLMAINNRAEMDAYVNTLLNLDVDLYLNAKATKGFPMARIYKNQSIGPGGSVYTPQPFRPKNEFGVEEDRVKLIRVVAKLEVKLEGTADQMAVANIYYRNAYRQFSLNAVPAQVLPAYYTDQPLKKAGNSYLYYMPEAMMTAPSWSLSGDRKPINYFVIETLSGTEYEIPIVSHDGAIAPGDYVKYAKGELGGPIDYNIYRNRHYTFTVENMQALEIMYQVQPWQEVKRELYMGYGYNVAVDNAGNIVVNNTIEACDPHSVRIETLGAFLFSDDTTFKIFNSLMPAASGEYTLKSIPVDGDGDYLRVLYNGIEVKRFSK